MIIFSLYAHGNDIHMSLAQAGNIVRSEKFFLEQKKISADLALCAQDFLADSKPQIIALHKGPTSFTTLRVCLSYIQGLAIGYDAKIFAPSHFELIQKAFSIQDGVIAINHNGSAYPGVCLKNGMMGDVEPFPNFTPFDFSSKNMAEELIHMYDAKKLISAFLLEPQYGLLPSYTKSKN